LTEVSARSATDLDAAFAGLQRIRPDAVVVLGNAVTLTHRKVI
jgi:hypothetical protein